jgi:hypothetical protein
LTIANHVTAFPLRAGGTVAAVVVVVVVVVVAGTVAGMVATVTGTVELVVGGVVVVVLVVVGDVEVVVVEVEVEVAGCDVVVDVVIGDIEVVATVTVVTNIVVVALGTVEVGACVEAALDVTETAGCGVGARAPVAVAEAEGTVVDEVDELDDVDETAPGVGTTSAKADGIAEVLAGTEAPADPGWRIGESNNAGGAPFAVSAIVVGTANPHTSDI